MKIGNTLGKTVFAIMLAICILLISCIPNAEFGSWKVEDVSIRFIPSKEAAKKGIFLEELTNGQKKIFVRLLLDSKISFPMKDSALLEGEYEFDVQYAGHPQKTYRIDTTDGFYETESGAIYRNPELVSFCQHLLILSILNN